MMTTFYDKNDRCILCKEHISEAHQRDCFFSDDNVQTAITEKKSLTEQQTRELLCATFKRRASQACYWKEMFQNENSTDSAEFQETIEAIWNEAADIAIGLRRE